MTHTAKPSQSVNTLGDLGGDASLERMQTQVAHLSDCDLEYVDRGEGPPVVFMHSLLTDPRHYRKLLGELSKTHRCILPVLPLGSHQLALPESAPNTPLDVARRVAELIAQLKLGPVTLVGNDSGGAISQLIAVHHREHVARMVLANCDAYEVFPPKEFEYLAWVSRSRRVVQLMGWLMQRARFLRHSPLAYGRLTESPMPDALVKSYAAPMARPDVARDVAKLCRAVVPELTLNAARQLKANPLPLRLVWGTADPFFPLALAKRLAADIAGAELTALPGVRAFVPEEAPGALLRAIQQPWPAEVALPGEGATVTGASAQSN